jgi:anti-sigma regulatory factor (Ser/Thr protein kinase)
VADPIDEGLESQSAHAVLSRDWRFPSTAWSVRAMRHELRPFLSLSELPASTIDDLLLAACEAAANGVEHARNPAEPFFDVHAEVDGPKVRILVRDYGRWATRRADPGDRGRGLHMMTMLAAVTLTSGSLGTSVTLRNLVDAGRPSGR